MGRWSSLNRGDFLARALGAAACCYVFGEFRVSIFEPRFRTSALAILIFLVPGHLDGFQLRLIGCCGIPGKPRQLGDPLVHVREAKLEAIQMAWHRSEEHTSE